MVEVRHNRTGVGHGGGTGLAGETAVAASGASIPLANRSTPATTMLDQIGRAIAKADSGKFDSDPARYRRLALAALKPLARPTGAMPMGTMPNATIRHQQPYSRTHYPANTSVAECQDGGYLDRGTNAKAMRRCFGR